MRQSGDPGNEVSPFDLNSIYRFNAKPVLFVQEYSSNSPKFIVVYQRMEHLQMPLSVYPHLVDALHETLVASQNEGIRILSQLLMHHPVTGFFWKFHLILYSLFTREA